MELREAQKFKGVWAGGRREALEDKWGMSGGSYRVSNSTGAEQRWNVAEGSGWPIRPLPINAGPAGASPQSQQAWVHLRGAGAVPHREPTSRYVVLSHRLLCPLALPEPT